jgi:mevalonate kinase
MTVPGKTFLLGEYCALKEGPSLIFTHSPCFNLKLSKNNTSVFNSFHPESPAGKLYADHLSLLEPYQFQFDDPYQGLGGLGASSAEFLSLYRIIKTLSSQKQSQKELLETYWHYAYQNKGMKPSGADLVAQSMGGLCFFYPQKAICDSHPWPFKDLSLILLHTRNKIATHTHLESLTLNQDIQTLNQAVLRAKGAIEQKNSSLFVECMTLFATELAKQQLVAPHTEAILTQLKKSPHVLTCKGAGAMGADIVIVICHRDAEKALIKTLNKSPWPILATQKDLFLP